jgi:hypothetical protein
MAENEKDPALELAKDQSADRVVELEHGHTLAVSPGGKTVEIRAPGGMVEIRVEMTEAGPVLRAEAARLEISAEEDVVIKGKHVSLNGSESVDLDSKGTLNASSAGELKITSAEQMRLRGEMIWLN